MMSIIRDVTLYAKKYLFDSDKIMLFIGARQAGKTTILKQLKDIVIKNSKKSDVVFINLEDPDYLRYLDESPKNIFNIVTIDLNKKTYLFVDEIQYLKNPTNFLKYIYDEYGEKIKLIVSGSSSFYIDNKFKDSLAGRKVIFNVYTLSFKEFLRFKEEDLLYKKLSVDFDINKSIHFTLREEEKIKKYFNEYMVFGGYPRVVLTDDKNQKIEELRELAYSYIKKDLYDSNVKQSNLFYKLLKMFSNQTGSLVNIGELSNTLSTSKTTINHLLYVMSKSFHIQLLSPFSKNVRKELTKMPKVYFLDLGLRNFFYGSFEPFEVRNDRGALFENTVFCQLRRKFNVFDIAFWRTVDKNEVDFIVDRKIALEVKTSLANFSLNKYNKFIRYYPEIAFNIISYVEDIKNNNMENINVLNFIDI